MYAALPGRYAYLAREGAPRLLVEMLALHGLREAPGAAENPDIVALAREVGLAGVYRSEETPWCGLGMAVAAHRAGYEITSAPLWALSWADWGAAAPVAMLGDVIVFKRSGGGHVGLYVGEDATHYHVLGCNQGDACSITRLPRTPWRSGMQIGVHAVRRSPWRVGQPSNVRPILLDASGPAGGKVT